MPLFLYEISPGDSDHMPANYFVHGIVEAEPKEVKAILRALASRHFDLLQIRPVEEVAVGLDQLRVDIGDGLSTYHGEEVSGTKPCKADQPYIDAYEARWGTRDTSDEEDDEGE